MPRLVAGVLLAACVAMAQQPPPSIRLEGRVLTITGEPVPRATLAVLSAVPTPGEAPRRFMETADDEGNFRWEGLPPSAYVFYAEKPGFVRQYYQARAAGSSGAVLTLEPGRVMTGLVFRLTPQGVVSGTVLDPASDPVPGMQVTALRPSYVTRGVRQMTQASTANTDDKGNFRVSNLAPGRYYLSVGVNEMRIAFNPADAPAPASETLVTTYYPSTLGLNTAAAVNVTAGAEVAGINIRMRRERVFKIRAHAVDSFGAPVTNAALFVRGKDEPSINSILRLILPPRSADGRFEFPNLLPGTYILQSQPRPPVLDPNGLPPPPPLAGRAEVVIADRDVDVEVRLLPGVTITATVRTEEGAAEPLRQAPPARLGLIEYEIPGTNNRGAPQNPEGAYELKDVALSTYAVVLSPLPRGLYVKSVRFGGRDVTRRPLDLTSGVGGALDILVSAKAADVSGVVRDDQGQIVPGAAVALWPAALEQSDITGGARVENSGPDGTFRFDNLPPGEFLLAAWDQAEPGRAENIEFRALFTSDASKVKIEESTHHTEQLKPISVERMNAQLALLARSARGISYSAGSWSFSIGAQRSVAGSPDRLNPHRW